MVDNKEFDFLGTRGSRPLEVATLRLQNMRQIVTKWNKLSPPDKELITQQGGTVVFEGRNKIYGYKDKVGFSHRPLAFPMLPEVVQRSSVGAHAKRREGRT